MIRIQATAVIRRPVQEVWPYLSQPENYPKWQNGLTITRVSPPDKTGVGQIVRVVRPFLGQRVEVETETTEVVPFRRLVSKVRAGPLAPQEFRVELTPIREGTFISYSITAEIGGFFRLAESFVTRMAKRQAEVDLARLKELLESDYEPDATAGNHGSEERQHSSMQ